MVIGRHNSGLLLRGWGAVLAFAWVGGCGPAAPSDGAADPDPAVPFVPSPDGELLLGVNVTGETVAESFTPLDPGDGLLVELGFQGSWMVVLALKTRGHPLPKKLDLDTRLFVNGEERALVKYRNKSLSASEDGYAYFYNIFLVTCDFAEYAGEAGTIEVELRAKGGEALLNASVDVMIEPPD